MVKKNKPVLIFFGGLLRLLHLSDEADTMMLYCMPQRTSWSSQKLEELLQEIRL